MTSSTAISVTRIQPEVATSLEPGGAFPILLHVVESRPSCPVPGSILEYSRSGSRGQGKKLGFRFTQDQVSPPTRHPSPSLYNGYISKTSQV